MPDDYIDDWAEAIKRHEGWHPCSRSYRNNNPGNIRGTGDTGESDDDGFAKYSSEQAGMEALKSDLRAKVEKYPDYSILEIMTRYLGGDPDDPQVTDQGDPFAYAQDVANALGVPVDTPLSDLETATSQSEEPEEPEEPSEPEEPEEPVPSPEPGPTPEPEPQPAPEPEAPSQPNPQPGPTPSEEEEGEEEGEEGAPSDDS